MNKKEMLTVVSVMWIINAILFVAAWFGGDMLIHSDNYSYMADSVYSMRWTLGTTKTILSIGLAACLVELGEN